MNKILIHQALKIIKQKVDKCNLVYGGGICAQFTELVKNEKSPTSLLVQVEELMWLWPKFSKDETFPVPHPTLSPKDAYRSHFCSEIMTWYEGEYAANRMELLDYLIEATK